MGFISKPLAEQMLLEKQSGTFLLRFSDSELGGVTIAYVRQPEMYPGREYTFGSFLKQISLFSRDLRHSFFPTTLTWPSRCSTYANFTGFSTKSVPD